MHADIRGALRYRAMQPRRVRSLIAGVGAIVAACASRAVPPAMPTGPAPQAASASAPSVATTCDPRVPLQVVRWHDVMRRIFLPVTIAGRATQLLIDTGSPHSFVFAPDSHGEPIAVTVGCHAFPFPQQPPTIAPTLSATANVAGVVGADAVYSGITDFNFADGTIEFRGDRLPAVTPTEVVPLEIVAGVALVQLTVDGRLRTLMLDTGTADLLLLEAPRSQPTQHTTDAFGAAIDFEVGTAELTSARGTTRTVPCWRTLHHPTFERHREIIGRPVDGLLGLSALGGKRVIVLPARHELWIAE